MGRPRTKPRPPKRRCRDCGGDTYTWTVDPLCPRCQKTLREAAPIEPARDFLRRTGRLAPTPGELAPTLDDVIRLGDIEDTVPRRGPGDLPEGY